MYALRRYFRINAIRIHVRTLCSRPESTAVPVGIHTVGLWFSRTRRPSVCRCAPEDGKNSTGKINVIVRCVRKPHPSSRPHTGMPRRSWSNNICRHMGTLFLKRRGDVKRVIRARHADNSFDVRDYNMTRTFAFCRCCYYLVWYMLFIRGICVHSPLIRRCTCATQFLFLNGNRLFVIIIRCFFTNFGNSSNFFLCSSKCTDLQKFNEN